MTSMHGVPFGKHETIRLGLVGAGGRGLGQLNELLACDGFEITAVADVNEAAVERAKQRVIDAGKKPPLVFSGRYAWQQLLELDIDLAYIATDWDSHAPIAVAAMKAGKHAAVEVPAAVTLDDCWQMVETSEATRRHCIMLENCCYDYWETIVKHMVEAGLLGEITHAECAYIHDLRSMLLQDRGEGLWRRDPHITRDSNHYPTHGLGPVAQILGIGEEDAFDYMVSMSSRSAALAEYRDVTLPPDDPKRQETYIAGDMNTSLIRTKLGRTIVLQHTVTLPRPYDRNFLISGTRGTFRDLPPRLFIDGISQGEEWLPLEPYKEQFEDPLWRQFGAQARALGGHGGMDYIMNYRLMQLMQQGLPPDMDVYDAADWSVPGALSEQSILQHSAVVNFPDFRRYQTF